jgi:high frequency lysogenization protein
VAVLLKLLGMVKWQQLMFAKPTHDQAMALAAVFQACYLVDQLANTGEASTAEMEVCIGALLNQNPESLADLFGSEQNLEAGVEAMTVLLGEHKDSELFRATTLVSTIAVLSIERQLNSRPVMLQNIAEGIDNATRQAEHFSVIHDNVFANIAALYQQTISTLSQRIQVKGNPIYLQQPGVAERIRCLLFAAVRSAFLWRQLGGKRYHLVVYRQALIRALKN